MKRLTMKRAAFGFLRRGKGFQFLLGYTLMITPLVAQTYVGPYPQTEISNGLLQAKVYLPDAEKGFYRGTRFDWAGVMASLEYKGHSYFGPFFEKFNPAVSDVVIGDPIEAGINSAASGPVEEFVNGPDGTALGYVEAKPGEAFCKIGVGALRKIDNAPYSSYTNYPMLSVGRRSVQSGRDWIEFTQQLDCGNGYSYTYVKKITLVKDEPMMTIEHRLINRGQKAISTHVYDHNFLSMDHQSTGPAITIRFPFAPKAGAGLEGLASIQGTQLVFSKAFKGSDTFYAEFTGFGKTASDYELTVENHTTGAGVVVRGDQPLTYVGVWAVRTVVAPEPYIQINVASGQEVDWKYTYTFYTITSDK